MITFKKILCIPLCLILLFSCFGCSEVGADIETVQEITQDSMTVYLDKTEFSVDEQPIAVHIKADGADKIEYNHPRLEKYTRSGWDYQGIDPMQFITDENPVDGVFTTDFYFGTLGIETVEPGTYRLTYTFSTTIDGVDHKGTFPLIFRIVE